MYPLDLLLNYLKTLDEVMLCELLDISSEDLLKAFKSKIQERHKFLEKEVEMLQITDEEINEEDWSGEQDTVGTDN
jgi:lipoate-protein ligase A